MATKTDTTQLAIQPRGAQHSRETRRLRRSGQVPGVIYGLGGDAVGFSVDAHDLRRALASSGAVFELDLEGERTPAVVKETQRHPVRGEVLHIDFVRVDLNTAIQADVSVHIVGGDDAPGVIAGGILAQETNEVTIEALPNEVPDAIEFDASKLEPAETVYVSALELPAGVTLVGEHLDEQVLVSVTTISHQELEPGIEAETEVVGEAQGGEDAGTGGEGASADATPETGDA